MSFWDNVKKITQPYSDEEYEDDDYEDGSEYTEEQEIPQPRRSSPAKQDSGYSSTPAGGFNGQVLSMGSGKQEVVLFHAKTFDDAAKAADELRRRKAIILNMENVDKALTRRVVDFLSGSIYALDGSVKKIAQATYLFCPHNMDVVGDLENVNAEMETYN
ncbi:MAG: cell division protein SepF [Oscillospiraceae bacterium]|nr:cell division protein SepF [Oscillospiraceae bacterium]